MSWVLAAVGFMLLIVFHELGHFAAAKAVGMRVEKFSLFFGQMWARTTRGETTYGIGWIPLGGYVKISGMNPYEELPDEVAHRAYYKQPVWKRIVVIAAGPAVNLLIAFVLIWGLLVFQGQSDTVTRAIDEVEPGTPAAQVLQRGDRILSVDGVTSVAKMPEQIDSHRCAGTPEPNCEATTPATIRYERDGQVHTAKITPIYDERVERNRLGFAFGFTDYEPVAPGTAVVKSLDGMWQVTRLTGETIGKLFYDSQARKDVSGVVGSYERAQQSFEMSTVKAVEIIALISLSLAVINLFPFLPLDGGHIFWALAEKVRGRPISFAVMERAGFVGFALVAILFLIGLNNDVARLTTDGFR
ncbi:MAG TPA: M50 family metallopeptidase [Capillimicrobium sp.]|nr:M50 family metallopeptidase [Capillimicrobium sp.]